MRLAVLHPPLDDLHAPGLAHDPDYDLSRFHPGHTWDTFVVAKATAVAQIRRIAAMGYDVLVNQCDGGWDDALPGVEVVAALERLGAPFTGAGSAFFDPPRDVMKLAAHAAGVRVPAYVVLRGEEELELARSLRFPLLVKPPQGASSADIAAASKVRDADALAARVRWMIERRGEALVEEFVEGRELTVLVAEPAVEGGPPRVWAPVEVRFPPGETFKHHHLKWVDHARMRTVPVTDERLADRAMGVATSVFERLEGDGYARLDLRVDEAGEVWFLEINPNPGVFYPEDELGSADVILSHDPAGHRGFVDHVLDAALRRARRQRRAWRLSFEGRSFGLRADAPIPAGAVIERFDGPPAEVVTLGRHTRPDTWRPVAHATEASATLRGRDLVALRDIGAGEAVTLDHAELGGGVTVGPWAEEAAVVPPRGARIRRERR